MFCFDRQLTIITMVVIIIVVIKVIMIKYLFLASIVKTLMIILMLGLEI